MQLIATVYGKNIKKGLQKQKKQTKGGVTIRRLGITRKVDSAGRVTLPRSIRDDLEIEGGHEVEFFLEDTDIVIRTRDEQDDICVFCGNITKEKFNNQPVCKICMRKLVEESRKNLDADD